MTDEGNTKTYNFVFGGDIVECLAAPISKKKAIFWLGRDGKDLLSQLDGSYFSEHRDWSDHDIDEIFNLKDAEIYAGCELRHGWLEIADEGCVPMYSVGLQDDADEAGNTHFLNVDEYVDIDFRNHIIDGKPTVIYFTSLSGKAEYDASIDLKEYEENYGDGEIPHWEVFVNENENHEDFITKFVFHGETVEPSIGGRYLFRRATLLVPQDDGSISRLEFTEVPPDE